jgi:hypothetical protein
VKGGALPPPSAAHGTPGTTASDMAYNSINTAAAAKNATAFAKSINPGVNAVHINTVLTGASRYATYVIFADVRGSEVPLGEIDGFRLTQDIFVSQIHDAIKTRISPEAPGL